MTETTLETEIDPVRYRAAPRPRAAAGVVAQRPRADRVIDAFLVAWHEYRRGWSLSRGYSNSDSTCQDYRAPTHWDWKNGASQERVEDEIMRGVDRAMGRIPNVPSRWRAALEFEARNLATGAKVWTSEGLPDDPAELEVLRLEARNMLMRELQREGVVSV